MISTAGLVALRNPWLGVGRGAFSPVFQGEMGTTNRYVHPENLLVQWFSEWGLPISIAVLGLITVAVWQARHRIRRSWSRTGALVAVASLVVHDMVDFCLEMPGIAVVAIATLAATVLDAPTVASNPDSAPRGTTSRVRWSPIASVVVGAACILPLAAQQTGAGVEELEVELQDELARGDRHHFASVLERGLSLHPGEASLALLAGADAVRHMDPAAPRWLSRAMSLAPGWAAPHELAAWWLFKRGAVDQALLEVREGARLEPGRVKEVLCAILRAQPRIEAVSRAAPKGPNGTVVLDLSARCFSPDDSVVREIDELLANRDDQPTRVVRRRAQRALRRGDLDTASVLAESLFANEPTAAHGVLLARVQAARGRPREALAVLTQVSERGHASRDVYERQARLYASVGDHEGMQAALERVRGSAAGSSAQLARARLLEGQLEEERNQLGKAAEAFSEAHRLDPDTRALRDLARVALAMGSERRALDAWDRLCDLDGGRGRACTARDELRARIERRRPGVQLTGTP